MILKKTTFVLGAGASWPYGFPLGSELVDLVCKTLEPTESSQRTALRLAGFSDAEITQLRDELHKARPSSIDRFLTWHPTLRPVGKAAMATILVPREKDKKFGQVARNDDWYQYLFDNMLGRGLTDFYRNRLSIVTFNFDRSFERALFRTLQHSFRLNHIDAAKACSHVQVVHIHGELGAPAWIYADAEGARAYGGPKPSPARGEGPNDLVPHDIRQCGEAIRLFSEDCPESAIEDALVLLEEAERVCFLGFGYQEDNIDKLRCSEWWRAERIYHGTTFGLEDGEEKGAERRFPERFQYLRADCRMFLRKTDYIRD